MSTARRATYKSADTPNMDEVICPNCAHQFRAIPQNVQAENASLREELELIRAALTGDDYASLPSDLPTVRMAHTIRADHDKFRNQVRDTCHRAEQAEKELAEAKRDYTEKDRQYHMDAINRLASFLAMSGTSFEVVQAAIDNMTRLVAQKNLAIQSAKEWREQKQRADSYALDIEELQEQLRQLNAAYHTETQAKILSDACYENQYHRAEQAEARALANEKERDEIAGLNQDQFLQLEYLRPVFEAAHALYMESEEYDFDDGLGRGAQQQFWDALASSFEPATEAIDAAIGAKHEG